MSTESKTTNRPEATQGGNEGIGHAYIDAPADTIYGFHSLEQQKDAASDKYKTRAMASAGEEPLEGDKEDTSFMNRKPGGGETLPGWNAAKEMVTG
ncbi:uncharacterized protein DSM5745_05002 [Aspergillus mulundensis]|uniref:Uncharacterized protein n=1 Tax=Aspergillus mulundensis TaxID=1810919 RepID=A0A3D8S570_9EURO|nr:Uncharacterized protein DSM5745_05002 [Aspergillus mulundensis]RDW81445.1 Uncharacterized protein DSM5745_05002 [Aspergillus mulundensis]